jgi:hypothetical protein
MRKCTKSFVIVKQVKLICASILLLGASFAFADPAAVIDDFSCSYRISDENGGWIYFSTTDQSHKVITDSGVRILTCHFDHDLDLPYAIGYQGFVCGISGKLTSDSKFLATPGGQATLVCKFNPAVD